MWIIWIAKDKITDWKCIEWNAYIFLNIDKNTYRTKYTFHKFIGEFEINTFYWDILYKFLDF